MRNGIEELARKMLKAAYRRRMTDFEVPDVVAPRDTEVVGELGYDDPNTEELWATERWLEDQEYIKPAPIGPRGGTMPGFYTITPAGMAFMEGA
jgi:hypothetical protein